MDTRSYFEMATEGLRPEAPTAFPIQRVGTITAQAPYLVPESAAFSGLAGEIVRALGPHTEADPAGLLLNALTEFGAMVGGMAETHVGSAKHPGALYVAFVGRTSRSRKGTTEREVSALMSAVEDGWEDRHRVGGFGSGESFIEHASENPGDAIYMVESEFARVLAVASREGSSASSVLRAAWDFSRLEHRIRNKPYAASPAPVAMVAHITADELTDGRHGLRMNDVMNGFGNRVLWCFVDRRQVLPNLEPLPVHVRNHLVGELRSVLEAARHAGVVRRSPDADDLWVDLYGRMAKDDPPGTVGALTSRAEAQVLRLSLIYALIDGCTTIERRHLMSAWEVWRYCRWSAQHVWVGRGTGDADVDRVAAILQAGDELTSRELDRMFYGHKNVSEIRARAVALGVAEEADRPTGGRHAKVLTAAGKAEKADGARSWWVLPDFLRVDIEDVSAGHGTSSACSALPAMEPQGNLARSEVDVADTSGEGAHDPDEPGWMQIQRDAGEVPETDDAVALARVKDVLGAREIA